MPGPPNQTTSLLTQSKLLTDAGFQNRVSMAILHTASSVISESASTPDHAARLQLAQNVMRDPGSYSRSMYTYVIVQNGIYQQAADHTLISDDDVQNTVNAMWDSWAAQMGASPAGAGMPFPPRLP